MPEMPGIQEKQPRCHIVGVPQGVPTREVRAACDTLSRECLDDITLAVRTWRDHGNLAVALSSVIKRFQLPGLTVVRSPRSDQECTIPEPAVLPFEPTDLDETHPALVPLSEQLWPSDARAQPCPRPSRRHRVLRSVVAPGLAIVFLSFYLFLEFGQFGSFFTNLVIILSMGLIAAAVWAVLSWRNGHWFVVPGGVVVRRSIIGWLSRRSRLYTPGNSILFVERTWPDWQATICEGYQSVGRSLTDVERAVLLAAWRSPVEPPDLSELFGSE